MTNTREKLLEAKYFLERMNENKAERDPFKYNLSAFLAAVRSVTWFMHKEFKAKAGFESWYSNKHLYSGRGFKKNKNKEKNPDESWNFIEAKRDFTIHQEPVRPSAHVNITTTAHISASASVSLVAMHPDGTVERREFEEPKQVPAKSEMTVKWQWYFEEILDKEVVTICKEHVDKLEALVNECESKFSPQSNT